MKMPFLDKFDFEGPPMKGAQGTVRLAQEKANGQLVAIKMIDVPNGSFSKDLLREMSLLAELKHDCIVSLRDVVYEDPVLYIVTERLSYGLLEHISSYPKKYPDLVKPLMKNLLEGLQLLHKNNILHRDIKPANLLVTDKNTLKICDFGHARAVMNPELTPGLVTLNYRAPELLLGKAEYTTAIDIWAAGCVFAEISSWEGGNVNGENKLPFMIADDDEDLKDSACDLSDENIDIEESAYDSLADEVDEMTLEEVPYKPLFGADSDDVGDILSEIFSLVGTPAEETWSGVTLLPNWATFHKYEGIDFNDHFRALGNHGADLLKVKVVTVVIFGDHKSIQTGLEKMEIGVRWGWFSGEIAYVSVRDSESRV